MIFTGTITHLSQKGLGVVKNMQNNISYFVYGTWPGDHGEFEVINKSLDNKKFAYAKLIRLVQPSPQRQTPSCQHLSLQENACTGCSWMIANYTAQLEQKQNRIRYAMQRVGFDIDKLSIQSIHPAPQVYGYRNRCQLKTDGLQLGFISESTHCIAPIHDCIILNDTCRNLLQTVQRQLPQSAWHTDSAQNWHTIDLDDNMQPGDIVIDRKRPFKQGNSQQNAWMQGWLQKRLAEHPNLGKVVELFCGSGNFTQFIAASNCDSILAFEADFDAVQRLKALNLKRTKPVVADLFSINSWKKIQHHVQDAKTLVLDPPRAGLKKHQGFFDSFRTLETIIYISCNPETFARDAWFFNQHGFTAVKIQPIDLFPHTPHVEVLSEFRHQ